MRSPNDDCLLCNERKATKTNSHIVPSFMTKSLLRNEKGNKAYLYSSDKTHLKMQTKQDSDKEDYILCPECESFFSALETYCAGRVHNRLWDIEVADQFELKSENGVAWKECKVVNPSIFRLFIYSILWRCSISQSSTFSRFNLVKEEENILQVCLNKCAYSSQRKLMENIEYLSSHIPALPFVIFTCESFAGQKSLVFCEPGKSNPYYLTLNEYILILSFNSNRDQDSFTFLNNSVISDFIKVGFFPLDFWNGILTDFVKRFTKKAVQNLQAAGELPFSIKKEVAKDQ